MKKLMKKLTLLFTSIMLVCMFGACGSSTDSDMAYVKEKGVLVRHFSAERIQEFNRITIGTKAQMDEFLRCVKEIVEEKNK